jgi:hypothetical protein
MVDDDSVSHWLADPRAGDAEDIRRRRERYYVGMVRVAGARLRGHACRENDEEDVAPSAFHSLCNGVGGGRVVGESAVIGGDGLDEGMAQFLRREPTPEAAARFAENYERLLSRPEDDTLRIIAVRKLEGHIKEVIDDERRTSPRTVDRKLNLIRKIWE